MLFEMNFKIAAIFNTWDVNWIQGPSYNLSRRVFEDVTFFVHCHRKANWEIYDEREETHYATGALIMALQPFATLRLQLGIVVYLNCIGLSLNSEFIGS